MQNQVTWREKYPLLHRLVCLIITLIGSIIIGALYGVAFALVKTPFVIFLCVGGIWIIAAAMTVLFGRRIWYFGLLLGTAGAWGMWLGWHVAITWPNLRAAQEFAQLWPFEWPEHFSRVLANRRFINSPFEPWLIAWLWLYEIALFLIAGFWGAWRGFK